MEGPPPPKPILIFDGDCGFCRGWIRRWQSLTRDRVDYAPYQEVADQFPTIPEERFRQAVQLVEPDGRTFEAADAVLRTLSYVPRRGWLHWCYRRVPGFAWASERTYRFVASHRRGLSALTRVISGRPDRPRSYLLSRWLFVRMLGVIYLIAFASLVVQIVGLVGENGIEPVTVRLERISERLGEEAYWRFPTLCWYNASDQFLKMMCWTGVGISALLIVGIAPTFMLILLWGLYLSLTAAGGTFLNFQWENLLLETGLLAVFFAPLRLLDRPSRSPPVSRIMLVLFWWLLFRLMFLSGVVKWEADEVWRNLTALTVHYETQPLPVWTAWYAHHLPLWWHKFSCAVMFVIEIILPFFIFGPRRLRQIAAFGTILLMVLIGVTGNYNFFNLLTIALCILLLDDAFWRMFVPRRRLAWLDRPRTAGWTISLRRPVHLALAVIVIVVSTGHGLLRLGWHPQLVERVRPLMTRVHPCRSINSYGLFANMTEKRPEIIIEGSNDLSDWKPYEFYWKPGDVNVAPRWVQPHQPRLDWQMWFAALGNYRRNPWFVSLVRRTLEGEPTVLAFFKTNPFPDKPPKYIRAVLYDYQFSDTKTKAETGAWWTRKRLGVYLPPVTLRAGQLQFAR